MTFFSVAIPAYEMNGFGVEVLEYSFGQLLKQSFRDFDIVIADHSMDNDFRIENLCYNWHNKLDIYHYRNQENRGNPAANTNYAISKSKGKYIRLLCQDDFLFYEGSLQDISDEISDDNENHSWFCSPYIHTWDRKHFFKVQIPSVNPIIHLVNTIGTPSCVTLKNVKGLPQMDTNLKYCYDTEFYKRVIDFYGQRKITNKINMVNYLWDNSISSKITPEFIVKEEEYIRNKYGE